MSAHPFSPTSRLSVTNNNELGQHNLQLGALSSKCNAWGVELEPSEDRNQANEVAATRTLHVLIVASHSTSLSSRISQRISHASMAAGGYLPAAVPRQRGYLTYVASFTSIASYTTYLALYYFLDLPLRSPYARLPATPAPSSSSTTSSTS